MLRKLVISHLVFVALSTGALYTSFAGSDLIWNMGLALAALNFSALAKSNHRWYLRFPFLLIWLFFYPNTVYMLTDIVRLGFPSVDFWAPSNNLLFLLGVPSILLGLMAGILSVRYAFDAIRLSHFYGRLVVMTVLSLWSSLFIYLNSQLHIPLWKLFSQPQLIWQQLLSGLSREALLFVLIFSSIQLSVLLLMDRDD